MSDLIERSAVIDLIDKYTQNMATDYWGTNYGIPSDVFEDEIMELPSVQPYTAEEIQKVQELVAVQIEKAYELGRESVQPKQEWIPVSERLPEDGENVLVTYKTTDKIHPCQYHDDGSRNPWYSYIDQCREHMNVVLAWIPLPEPYMKGDTT